MFIRGFMYISSSHFLLCTMCMRQLHVYVLSEVLSAACFYVVYLMAFEIVLMYLQSRDSNRVVTLTYGGKVSIPVGFRRLVCLS
jgi:hypothetical protein